MSREHRYDTQRPIEDDGLDGTTPGRRTHTESLVFRKANGDAPVRGLDEGFAAATRGAGSELPHRREMEHAFGHDFSGVSAFTGAKQDLSSIGASAAAMGERVAFADASPDKATLAHELAHVVQQRAGAGPGAAAEAHADAVGDAVAAGRSPRALLDVMPAGRGAPAPQRKSPDYAAMTPVDAVAKALAEDEEDDALAQADRVKSKGDADTILRSHREAAVSTFGDATMAEFCAKLVAAKGDLVEALRCMNEEGTSWKHLRMVIGAAAAGDRAPVLDSELRELFVSECNDDEMKEALRLMSAGKLVKRLNWAAAEGIDDADFYVELVEGGPAGDRAAVMNDPSVVQAIQKLPADKRARISDLCVGRAAAKPADTAMAKDAVARTVGLLDKGIFCEDDEAIAALDSLTSLPPDVLEEAMKLLDDDSFDVLMDNVPDSHRPQLAKLVPAEHDPRRKLALWKAQATAEAERDEKRSREPDEKKKRARRGSTEAEIADETGLLEKELEAGTLTEKEVAEVVERKDLERRLEVEYGINLTNDRPGDNVDPDEHGPRGRQVWTLAQLQALEPELKRIPKEHLSGVKEFRRADANYYQDASGAWKNSGAGAMHHSGGLIEMYTANAGAPGGTFVHELAHDVDENNQAASNKFKDAAGWMDFPDKDALKKHLVNDGGLSPGDADARIVAIDAERGLDKSVRKGVSIKDKIYIISQWDHAGRAFKAYDADAIPAIGEAEATTDGWRDEHDYERTGAADHFADVYKLMIRDPVRLHVDYVDRPKERLAAAEVNLDKLTKSGAAAADIASAKADVKRREAQATGLRKQWDIMREEVFKVDEKVVAKLATSVPADKIEAFKKQGERCATPDQLEKLVTLYQTGKQVDAAAIAAKATLLAAKLPAAEVDAFKKDAETCFTPEQLDVLYDGYDQGRRRSGDWLPKQALILGY